jgi:hypothetical protein
MRRRDKIAELFCAGGADPESIPPSIRAALWILRCAIAHRSSRFARPGMTAGLDSLSPISTDLPVVPICRRKFGLRCRANHQHLSARPVPAERGVSRSSQNVGRGMRWTLWRDRRTRSRRTAKSCGPDISTPISSLQDDDLAGDGDKQARSPGRARRKPLKPLRGECRVNPV